MRLTCSQSATTTGLCRGPAIGCWNNCRKKSQPPIHIAAIRREAAYYVGKKNNGVIRVLHATVEQLEEISELVGDYAKGREERVGTADKKS